MRSIIENHVEEFLRILMYDKTRWGEIWRSLKKRFFPLLDEYEKALNLADGKLMELLVSIRRMDLDRFRRFWLESKRRVKEEIGHSFRMRADKLELRKEDFVVFLFSGVGVEDYVLVNGKREKVFMFDVFKFWREDRIEDLPNEIIKAVEKYRSGGG